MKLNPIILFIVIATAIYIGLNINNEQVNQINLNGNNEETIKGKEQTGLTPKYFMDYLSKNNFEIFPVFRGTTSDIYSGRTFLSDSKIEVQVDVYHERESDEVLLIEVNITAVGYVNHPDQKGAEDLVNKVAEGYFIPFAKIPYNGSDPEAAEQWVKSNLLSSYSVEPKGKTSTVIGPATINIYGNPLFRTLEIDFGFAEWESVNLLEGLIICQSIRLCIVSNLISQYTTYHNCINLNLKGVLPQRELWAEAPRAF